MKKIILSVLIFGILLSGCNENTSLSKDDLFEKKKECASYEQEIKSNLPQLWEIKEIFYSPIENSCLYRRKEIAVLNNWDITVRHEIIDFLSKKSLFTRFEREVNGQQEKRSEDNIIQMDQLRGEIKRLKWE